MTDREIRDQLYNGGNNFANEKVMEIGKTATDVYMAVGAEDCKDLDKVCCCRQIAEVLHGVLGVGKEKE